MPSLRELKKRLKSAETIEQLSDAMRTASTAKYVKAGGALSTFGPYASALLETRELVGSARGDEPRGDGRIVLLISGNHGLCGGYHHDLFAFFEKTALKSGDLTVTCGQRAREFCRTRGIGEAAHFSVSDVPTFGEAKELADLVRSLMESEKKGSVSAVFQRFVNMMRYTPVEEPLFGGGEIPRGGEEREVILIPDRATVCSSLDRLADESEVYEKLLSASAAAQSATAVAMRSAGDNAGQSIASLKGRINRLRQASVTESVLETSAEIKE